MGRFADSLRELEERIGDGALVGSVGFSGASAVAQHEGVGSRYSPPSWAGKARLVYTAGGGPGYLSGPLQERYGRYLQAIADALLDEGPRKAMERSMDDLKAEAVRRAPKETGQLARSARAQVRG